MWHTHPSPQFVINFLCRLQDAGPQDICLALLVMQFMLSHNSHLGCDCILVHAKLCVKLCFSPLISREVLMTPHSWQYAVLLNKFSFSSEVENELRLKGYRLLFPETSPCFRPSLKCYITSASGRFPAQKHRAGKLKDYYLLNAASVLAVLALGVESGEKVLDMCAAPGGKSIAMLQYAWPGNPLHS